MTYFDAAIQGIVQGLTEFLPVSSSGHLLISQHILGVSENNLFFDVMLHIGTLMAVLAVYYKTIWKLILAFFELIRMIFKKEFKFNELTCEQNMVIALFVGLLPLGLMFVPVPFSGTNVKGIAQQLAECGSLFMVGIALIATSVMLKMGINKRNSYKMSVVKRAESDISEHFDGKKQLSIMDSVYIGVTQLIAAIFPGFSRSGSTLSTGLLRGINKQTALDYSFILGIPSVMAAALLEFKEAAENGGIGSENLAPVIIGMVTSAVVGFLAIKIFKWLLKTDKMSIFVVYTLIVGSVCVIIDIVEKIKGFNVFTGSAI